MLSDLCIGGSVGTVGEFQWAAILGHGNVEDLGDMLAGTNLLCQFGEAFAAIAFPFGARLLGPSQFGLQFF